MILDTVTVSEALVFTGCSRKAEKSPPPSETHSPSCDGVQQSELQGRKLGFPGDCPRGQLWKADDCLSVLPGGHRDGKPTGNGWEQGGYTSPQMKKLRLMGSAVSYFCTSVSP